MEEVSPMIIDGANNRTTKIDDSDQKKKNSVKRKRLETCSYPASPEEKQAKINSFREEINSLVKFCKDLVLKNKGELVANVENVGNCAAALNRVIACALEESDLPLSKLVDEIFGKVVDKIGNGDSVTKASVKSTVLSIGQRLCYGVTNAYADVLEDEAECALWCWETRDLKLIPKLARVTLKVCRTYRKKIHERITAVLAMISALEKSVDHQSCLQELMKASEKLAKVLSEADIRLLMENMSQKSGYEMAEKEAKREEKLLIKKMEESKKEAEKERKKMDRELQKQKLQNEKELKRLRDETEKEERRREKEESEMQKHLKRQQEETEKDQIRKDKEEAEFKRQLAIKKQASLMERFLKRNQAYSTSENDSSVNKAVTSESSSNMIEEKFQSVTLAMDSVLSQNSSVEVEDIWKSHLNSWRRIGRLTGSNRKVHWGIRQKPKTKLVKELKLTTNKELICDEDSGIEKLVGGWVDSNPSGRLSQMNMDSPSSQRRILSMQLLQFDKSHRPAFYGVWPRKSQVVGGRLPFAKDPDIDYEIDSDEEWEEDEPGESLSDCDKDDEDEIVEGRLKGDDEDESEDGFFVPDGYLSENEGVQADEMESDELVEEGRKVPSSEQQVQSEEFCTLLRQQKYLNNLTEHALKKNQPLIIMNLMHEKTALSSTEELTGTEKLEQMCLQTLCIRPLPGFPNIEISIQDNMVDKDLEASSNKSASVLANTAALSDSDLPQIIFAIQSCPHSIGKIVKLLHNKFPDVPKSQLRNKVRETSEFSDNRWQVKKEILSKLGLSISPDKNCEKATSIATFFSKRCLPPSQTTMNLNETSPHSSQKPVAVIQPQDDCTRERL